MFADVIVDITNAEVDKIFEYSFTNLSVSLGSRVIVPFGNKFIEGIVIRVKTDSEFSASKIKPILRVLEDTPAMTKEAISLMDYVKSKYFVTRATALRLFLPSEMRKGKTKESFIKYCCLVEGANLENALNSLRKSAIKQHEFLNFIFENKKCKLSFVNEKFGASSVKSIIEKGFVQVIVEQNIRSPYKDLIDVKKEISLTEKQIKAVESIENTDRQVTLLHGVTGSGKTEIYLNLIDNAIKSGKSAIMLVPEISLTPQMLKQLRARFKENVSILHSGLSAGERFDEWWRLRSGEAKIAIGARSAIFAPIEDVGIIIIDEEHDGSYVSETAPRYNTIDVAKFRASYNGAKIVLGSATPSIESYMKATNGEYNLAVLPDRINKKPLPEVEIVDMRKEVRRGNNSPFSQALRQEIQSCLDKNNQVILFLNQRGFSKSVICTECGHVQTCDSCDVSLTYHREDNALLCHYCGAKYKMVDACTNCGSTFLRYGGTGTERVVHELKNLFPSARILRMDRDTTQTKEGHFKILNEFSSHNADILVGTQMIAKGHDFPFVTLVGILDADMSLHFSDYRSSERTFQLLTQVAGRSGRAEETGKVILQTYSPSHPVLMQSVKYDYENFFKTEVSIRSATGFPPFTDIVRVLISGGDEEKTLETTKKVYESLNLIYLEEKENFKFFGCMKAPLTRLQNKFRFQVLMRIKAENNNLLNKIYNASYPFRSRIVSINMEVNPNNLT